MIDVYFAQIEKSIQDFPSIRSYTLSKKVYNIKQGFINGTLVFEDNSQLEFIEVKNTDIPEKIKYRYHYMDKEQNMLFRYDNAPHHGHLSTFPHHKHCPTEVQEHDEPTLYEVLLEIAQFFLYHYFSEKSL